jgi:hypothetical protein
MFDTKMEPSIARDMIKGAADPLESAFQLRYSQLLQVARTEGTSAEMLLQVGRRAAATAIMIMMMVVGMFCDDDDGGDDELVTC